MTANIEDRTEEVGLRERKKKQTRLAIHEAAFRLIDAQGLEATTVEQICQEADVSSRTFFNYYSSKAAAAFEISGAGIDATAQERFRSAEGGLVDALCEAIGRSADLGPTHVRVKSLVIRHPELLPTVSRMMLEVRDGFVALAVERADSREQAELAVTLVMAAMGRVMHDDSAPDAPLVERLHETIDELMRVGRAPLCPVAHDR